MEYRKDIWTNYINPHEVTAVQNGEFAKFQIELTPNATESDARLIFYLGEETSWIKLDQVRLWPQQATKISDTTPEFSAIYDDPDTGDYADYYQIQVIPYDGDWNDPLWDSSKTAFTTSVLEGDRTEDISYGGDPLALNGMKYNWRIKLWDDSDNEGDWTNGNDYFVMAGKRIQDLSYSYDDVGNITEIIDQSETNTRKNAAYAYDDLYRLTSAIITDSATEDDYTQTYSYDSLGNILNKSDVGDYEYNGNTGSVYANPHAVTDLTDLNIEMSYDNNGNLDTEMLGAYTVLEASWDYNNRLTSADGLAVSAPASYAYDHTGQRILQDLDSGDDVTVYPNKFYNVNTKDEVAKVTEHIFANGEPLATIEIQGENVNLYYIHGDHLNSSSVMTDSIAETNQVIDYYPFGSMRFNEQSENENPFDEQRKHTGHEYDNNTDLTYMNARYYTGVAGRFVSEDPLFLDIGGNIKRYGKKLDEILVNPQSLNSYSYVTNRPLVYTDPTGEAEWWAWLNPLAAISQIRAWQGVANYFSSHGDKVASTLYNHSLQPNVGNLDIVATDSNKYSFIANAVKNSNEFKAFLNNKLESFHENAKNSEDAVYSQTYDSSNGTVVFNSTEDLKYSIYHTDSTTLSYDKSTGVTNVSIHDTFNFDRPSGLNYYNGDFKAALGNDLGLNSQNTGVLSQYKVDIKFNLE